MSDVPTTPSGRIRVAAVEDSSQLLSLWTSLFDENDIAEHESWTDHARLWFAGVVDDASTAYFPVLEDGGVIVATAIGTLELGVPNPHCPRGRTVRLANVITLPEHRRRGYGTLLVREVVQWARSVCADRVDLSATAAGQRIYDEVGFVLTSAPRMKLVLD